MKIAFIGSHGVGKTTLCYDLAGALKREGVHVDMVKEVARLGGNVSGLVPAAVERRLAARFSESKV